MDYSNLIRQPCLWRHLEIVHHAGDTPTGKRIHGISHDDPPFCLDVFFTSHVDFKEVALILASPSELYHSRIVYQVLMFRNFSLKVQRLPPCICHDNTTIGQV